MNQAKPKRRKRQTVPEDSAPMTERPSYRCSTPEFEAAVREASRRGMTFSRFVRLAVNGEMKRGGK